MKKVVPVIIFEGKATVFLEEDNYVFIQTCLNKEKYMRMHEKDRVQLLSEDGCNGC